MPYERIQDVSLEAKPLPRLLGLVAVKFETGAGTGAVPAAGSAAPADASLEFSNPAATSANAFTNTSGGLNSNKTFTITRDSDRSVRGSTIAADTVSIYGRDCIPQKFTFTNSKTNWFVPPGPDTHFELRIGNRVLSAENPTSVDDLVQKLQKDSDYGFVLSEAGHPDGFPLFEASTGVTDASGAAAQKMTINFSKYANSIGSLRQTSNNITIAHWLTLARRIKAMEAWLANPVLLEADADADYAAVIEINLDEITEPILACPNDPDNVKLLSEEAGKPIDEVFIGSCMTNIGHYRAAANVLEGQGQNAARLWVCPPTRMDEEKLKEEGYYATFEAAGSRMEMPGCSLCMGNQARVEDNTTVFSTSTRNFNNRLGNGAQVYLGSAELAAVCAQLGRIPSKTEYLTIAAEKIDPYGAELYRYLNFDQIEGFEDQGRVVSAEEEAKVLAGV